MAEKVEPGFSGSPLARPHHLSPRQRVMCTRVKGLHPSAASPRGPGAPSLSRTLNPLVAAKQLGRPCVLRDMADVNQNFPLFPGTSDHIFVGKQRFFVLPGELKSHV